MSLSIVAPVFNEAETLPVFFERTRAVLDELGEPYELIFVDDGSRDQSLYLLREFRAADARVKILSFARNFGHQIAITAGLDVA
ncbi:MAG: glycosyltransferase, partial [Chloroflexi bacterium]|nr:glycosyltransferase [Chloroflexota bacterium]